MAPRQPWRGVLARPSGDPRGVGRQSDLELRLDEGRVYHLELQSAGDAAMPWRMHEYYSLIRQQYQIPVLQQVLYVGQGPNTFADSLE